jgi:hypothetical protein
VLGGAPQRTRPGADDLAAARAELRRLAAADVPVIAGPWYAEVGYELLYWIPFLRWALEVEPDLRGRLVVVSRGGTRAWYDGVGADYRDLYDAVAPEELEALESEGALRKQVGERPHDSDLLERVGLGGSGAPILHPSLFFELLRPILKGAFRFDELPLRFAPLRVEPSDPALELPERFVAVRFYARPSLPDDPDVRRHVADIVSSLARSGDVVLLDSRRRYDDHDEIPLPDDVPVTRVSADDAATNLAQQAAVIGGAEAFVGTYGGLAYLPSFLGVPSLSFYSEPRFRRQHLELAQRVFSQPSYGRFDVLDFAAVPLLRHALTRVSG